MSRERIARTAHTTKTQAIEDIRDRIGECSGVLAHAIESQLAGNESDIGFLCFVKRELERLQDELDRLTLSKVPLPS